MKLCFKIHPDDFDKTANEKFYEQMASKGWLLKKRWANLSQFEKTEPQELKFDIYYCEYYSVSDDEKAEFEAHGRTTVKVRSNVHVSYAPKAAALPPVIKSNEDAAKAILPLKAKGNRHIPELIILWILSGYKNWADNLIYNPFADMTYTDRLKYNVIATPEIYIAFLVLAAFLIFILVYEQNKWKKAVKIFQNGDNLDNKSKKKIIYIANLIVVLFSVVCLSVTTYCSFTKDEYAVPSVSDGLYLDINELEIEDIIIDTGLQTGRENIPNNVMHAKTLTAEMWHTRELYQFEGDNKLYFYQDVIKYNSPKLASVAAEMLIPDEKTAYTETDVNGFEKVYLSGNSFVAVIGNTVHRCHCVLGKEYVLPEAEKMLELILAKHTE